VSSQTVLIGFHPVFDALRAGRPLERVHLAKGLAGKRVQQILDLCRDRNVAVRREERATLDRMSGGGVHQGIAATRGGSQYAELDAVIAGARLLVVLDGVEDPHNLGAIIRSAHAAGADGAVIPERRAAGLTPAAVKASAGASELLPIARAGNINRALGALKGRGFWIYGLDERGAEAYDQVAYHTPTALVIGAEGKGLHEQVKKHCDVLVRIPMAGQLSSLNVSAASAIALFEWKRRFGDNQG
jgi:23S rRNA (guanosine2251-2'-O)-methyltransferase